MKPEAGAFYFDKADCTLWYCPTGSTAFGWVELEKVNKSSDEDGIRRCPLKTFKRDLKKVAFLINEEAK